MVGGLLSDGDWPPFGTSANIPPVSLLFLRAFAQTDAPRLIHAVCTHEVKGGIGLISETPCTRRHGVFSFLVGVASALRAVSI